MQQAAVDSLNEPTHRYLSYWRVEVGFLLCACNLTGMHVRERDAVVLREYTSLAQESRQERVIRKSGTRYYPMWHVYNTVHSASTLRCRRETVHACQVRSVATDA